MFNVDKVKGKLREKSIVAENYDSLLVTMKLKQTERFTHNTGIWIIINETENYFPIKRFNFFTMGNTI